MAWVLALPFPSWLFTGEGRFVFLFVKCGHTGLMGQSVNELCVKVHYELQSKDQMQHYDTVSSHSSPSAAASVYLDLIQNT